MKSFFAQFLLNCRIIVPIRFYFSQLANVGKMLRVNIVIFRFDTYRLKIIRKFESSTCTGTLYGGALIHWQLNVGLGPEKRSLHEGSLINHSSST